MWDQGYDDYPTLENYFFGVVKLVKNVNIDKCKYSGYGIGFGGRGTFSVANGFGKNTTIFGVDVSSSAHVEKKFLFLVEVLKRIRWYYIDCKKSIQSILLSPERNFVEACIIVELIVTCLLMV